MDKLTPDLVSSVPETAPEPESVQEETPSEPESSTEAPAEEVPAEEPQAEPEVPNAEPEEQLYELPDGRKVDAQTLQKEWKENFLPDYTRKSQKVAEYERGGQHINKTDEDLPAWKRPDYVPQSYAEIIEIAKQQAIEDLESSRKAEEARQSEIASKVDEQIADIKKDNPNLDESALFQHANKYHFSDLKLAYENMKEMKNAEVRTEQRVVKNLTKRKEDPVSGAPSPSGSDSGVNPNAINQYGSALEFFRGISK